jgi:hypothetical protein
MAKQAHKVAAAVAAIAVAEPALALAHTGGVGALVGLVIGVAAYNSVDDIERVTGRELPSLPASPKKVENRNELSLGYRLLHGKSVREDFPHEKTNISDETVPFTPPISVRNIQPKAVVDELLAPVSQEFTFSQLIQSGFVPSLGKIFLAKRMDGTPVFSTAKELCHVALAGATGGGKTSLIRLIMSQLCYAGANVLLLNPHFTHYDIEAEEDWTPFEPYLVYDPMECRKYETIEFYLKQVALDLLPKRLDKYAKSEPWGKPYFIVLDELPAIVDNVPDAPKYLSKILREGRKVGIYLVTAAQDFLVKTIAPEGGGAIRDCYRTAIYVGGDPTTAKVLLDMPANQIPENDLGKGMVMLRNLTVKKASAARVPYVDNQSLYDLLGPSTYIATPANDMDGADELVLAQEQDAPDTSLDQLMEHLNSMPDVDPTDNRYTDELEVVDDDEEDGRVVLGKKNTGEAVSISKEEFQVAVRMRQAKMSTGYRDYIQVFNISEHHAKTLNALVRQELSSEAV